MEARCIDGRMADEVLLVHLRHDDQRVVAARRERGHSAPIQVLGAPVRFRLDVEPRAVKRDRLRGPPAQRSDVLVRVVDIEPLVAQQRRQPRVAPDRPAEWIRGRDHDLGHSRKTPRLVLLRAQQDVFVLRRLGEHRRHQSLCVVQDPGVTGTAGIDTDLHRCRRGSSPSRGASFSSRYTQTIGPFPPHSAGSNVRTGDMVPSSV